MAGSSDRRPKFVVDAMHGKLARWLRMLGYSAEYDPAGSDEEIIAEAERTGSTVLTSDVELYREALRRGLDAVLVPTNTEGALLEVARRCGIELRIDPERTRCPLCNSPLRIVRREEVEGLVPEGVLRRHKSFWKCDACGKVYWKGGHWREIERLLKRLCSELHSSP